MKSTSGAENQAGAQNADENCGEPGVHIVLCQTLHNKTDGDGHSNYALREQIVHEPEAPAGTPPALWVETHWTSIGRDIRHSIARRSKRKGTRTLSLLIGVGWS